MNVAARYTLSMGRPPHRADGGGVTSPVVTGPLLGIGGGRADTRNDNVPSGAFVIPADIVSGLPSAQGNSLAGHVALNKLFNSLPLTPDEAPYGADKMKLPRGSTIPGLMNMHHLMRSELGASKGGKVPEYGGKPIEIASSDGEYTVDAKFVRRLGYADPDHAKRNNWELTDMERGHKILDQWVDEERQKNIKRLQKLPGTVKDGTK
jgi:hypothetical protein